MAIPHSNETPRVRYLRDIVDQIDIEQVLGWSPPNDDDCALFARVIHVYSTIDFLLRFAAEMMDAQGLLSKSWDGKIAAQPISVISREIQSNRMWHESHRVAFERIELHRRVRNMVSHFVIRRIPGEDAFVFMTKSAADYRQAFGAIPDVNQMLFGVTDAAQIRSVLPELRNLSAWLAKTCHGLSHPIGTPQLPEAGPLAR